jgi:anti-sigma regulatory factor (Ser/Thr protein kinase)
LAACGFAGTDLADVETAVGEALANAAEHGHRPGSGFEVRVHLDRERVVIEIEDEGGGFPGAPGPAAASPPHDALRGFGIYLMRQLMDEVSFDERGTCVRLTKRLTIARGRDASTG